MANQIVLKLADDDTLNEVGAAIKDSGAVLVDMRRYGVSDADSGAAGEFADPVTAILIGGGALALAKFVADWWDRRRGGTVIDLRGGAEDEIRRDRDVPHGWVLIFPKDGGEARIEVKDQPVDWVERILEKVIDGTLGTAEAIVNAVSQSPSTSGEPA